VRIFTEAITKRRCLLNEFVASPQKVFIPKISIQIGVLMSDLTKEEIKSLVVKGWSCDDYKGLCKIQSHKGIKNSIIYDPKGEVTPNQIADDKNFEGNAVILHIGQVIAKLGPGGLTKDALIIPPGKFVFFMTIECVNMPLEYRWFTVHESPHLKPRPALFYAGPRRSRFSRTSYGNIAQHDESTNKA
jgi:hypothetical protein